MKKIINHPEAFVDETIEGILLAHPAHLKRASGTIQRVFIGEYATSMEMAGASISLLKLDDELLALLDAPAYSPFLPQWRAAR